MAALILPSRWTRQPAGHGELDPSHWLYPAIMHCASFAQDVDVKTNKALTVQGTRPSAIASSSGVARRFTSFANRFTFAGSSSNPSKILVLAVASVDAGVTASFIASRNFASNAVPFVLFGRFAGLGLHAGFGFYDGSWRAVGGSDIRGTGPRTLVGSYDGSTIKSFLDGKLEGSQSFTGSLSVNSNDIDIGAYVNDEASANGNIALLYVVNGDILPVTTELARELSANPWQIFRPLVRRIYFDLGAGGGTPNISPSGIASVEAFGSATVSRSSVQSIAATGVASAEAFGGVTVARTSVQAVSATGIASAEAFGVATVARSSVQAVAPSGIASAEAFGTATVTRSSVQTVTPTGIASAEAFGTHTITPGGVVVPQGIPSAEAFGTATFTRTSVQSVSATGIASGEAFGSATVTRTSAQSIVVSGIASGEAFGSATFTRIGQGVVAPQGIASAEAFGTATFTRTSVKTITATGIASSEAFGAPVVSIPGDRTLTAQDLVDIADAVWAHPKALTIARFLGLK